MSELVAEVAQSSADASIKDVISVRHFDSADELGLELEFSLYGFTESLFELGLS